MVEAILPLWIGGQKEVSVVADEFAESARGLIAVRGGAETSRVKET